MKRGQIYSSGWLKAPDLLDQGLENGMDLTIKSVRTAEMDDGKEQRVLSFIEAETDLGLNATNWDSIAALTKQDDDDGWKGTIINVYPHKLDRPYNGKTHGIRVREPQGVGPAHGSNGKAKPAPVASAVNGAEAARREAFLALKEQMLASNPAVPDADIKTAWLQKVAAKFPAPRNQTQVTAQEWKAFTAQLQSYQGEVAPEIPVDADIPF